MTKAWKDVTNDLIPMSISEKTELKIRKILNSIGEEMIEICELMNNENNK